MTEYEKSFLARHGEIALMPLIENWERTHGVNHSGTVTFEDRWIAFIKATSDTARLAA